MVLRFFVRIAGQDGAADGRSSAVHGYADRHAMVMPTATALGLEGTPAAGHKSPEELIFLHHLPSASERVFRDRVFSTVGESDASEHPRIRVKLAIEPCVYGAAGGLQGNRDVVPPVHAMSRVDERFAKSADEQHTVAKPFTLERQRGQGQRLNEAACIGFCSMRMQRGQ